MSINFPSNPVLDQVYGFEDRSWRWNGEYWQSITATIGYAGSQGDTGYTGSIGGAGYTGSQGESTFTYGATPPENPALGDRWYDSVRGFLVVYVDDGDSQQWVDVSGSGYMGQKGYTGSAGNITANIDQSTAGSVLVNDGTSASWAAGTMMFRNRVINGNFDIWQRGTSQTATGYLSVDRWQLGVIGSSVTLSRQSFDLGQTDVPNNPKYYMRHTVTSVAGATSIVATQQRIEGVETLSGGAATLSFWAKADTNKNIAVEFLQNFGTGGSPSASVEAIESQLVALTTVWTKYSITVDLPSVSGKSFGTNGNDFLLVQFWFDAGSNYDTRSASLGQQSGTFDIAQVQLEEGSVSTNFEMRPIGMELSLCQRYYWQGYPPRMWNFTGSTIAVASPFSFPVTMRATPTITFGGANGTSATADYMSGYKNSIGSGGSFVPTASTADAEL